MINRRDLMRLNARVVQLETLAKAQGAQGRLVDSVHHIDVGSAPMKGPDTAPVTIAAEAARRQGKFWEYHDTLFANQKQLEPADLKRYAAQLGLDTVRFERDCADPALKEKVFSDMAEATSLSVHSTPTFFINGRLVQGAMPYETFATIIDEELAKQNTARQHPSASN